MIMHSCICQSYSDIFTILGWNQLFGEEALSLLLMKTIQMEAQIFRWKKVTHNHEQAILPLDFFLVRLYFLIFFGFFCCCFFSMV